jgi:hypothetical protein
MQLIFRKGTRKSLEVLQIKIQFSWEIFSTETRIEHNWFPLFTALSFCTVLEGSNSTLIPDNRNVCVVHYIFHSAR